MSGNYKSPGIYFSDSLQLTNYILDSGAKCHMTPQVSYFIPLLLEDTDKYIGFADGHQVTAKKNRQVQIKMCDDNGDSFIMKFHNVLLALDVCDSLL